MPQMGHGHGRSAYTTFLIICTSVEEPLFINSGFSQQPTVLPSQGKTKFKTRNNMTSEMMVDGVAKQKKKKYVKM